jgi:3-hydroxybutyryl-CoA dehydrogenase
MINRACYCLATAPLSAMSTIIQPTKTLVVLGAGQMGAGIAQVFAQHQFKVVLVDRVAEALHRAEADITRRLDKLEASNTITSQERHETLQRLSFTTNLPIACQQADGAIEAVTENEAIKTTLFAQLDAALPPHALLASNTSSISITRLAAVTQRPQLVVGIHFMNPVPVMPLVEVIAGLKTSPDTLALAHQWVVALGKTAVDSADFPGFIANRILMPMINEAFHTVHQGIATPQAVDTVMRLGMKHPMGPLQLADFIGLDTVLSILTVLHQGFGDPKFSPCPLLKQLVDAGYLGKKTGRGVYTY